MKKAFADSPYGELADQLNANLSRFSAYKAAHVEKAFKDILNDPKFNDEQRRVAVRAAEEKFARWTDAEYNTATARCITAEQFAEFNDPEHTSLFPNLEWLATRSTNPREEHQAFVGLILPKDHPFWRTHTPGTEWNCKCDLAETDDPASNVANLPTAKVPKGLEGNPFYTGEVFTKDVGYIRNAAKDVENFISKCYYPDRIKESMQISVMADRRELIDNINTGRILADNESVTIRPHFDQEPGKPIKNPEYLINGVLADAKRVQSPKGISTGFSAAKKQGAKIVIIDFSKAKYYNHNDAARALLNRMSDFTSGEVKECDVVYKGKYLNLNAKHYNKILNAERGQQIEYFETLLKKAFD